MASTKGYQIEPKNMMHQSKERLKFMNTSQLSLGLQSSVKSREGKRRAQSQLRTYLD